MLFQRLGLFFAVFSFLLFLQCESKHNLKTKVRSRTKMISKIIGGSTVPIEKFPFAVQFLNSGTLCGGVIIHSWAIITAAHCLDDYKNKNNMSILAGATYLKDIRADRYRVFHFQQHEEYMKETRYSCDIALVFLTFPFKFGDKVKKTILVTHDKWMDEKENKFQVFGWGHTQVNGRPSKVLQMTHLRYESPMICSVVFNETITSSMICLHGDGVHGSCMGDSGSGVIWNDMLVGITSFGYGGGEYSGKYVLPAVYTNIWVMRDWIDKSLNKFYSLYCSWKLSIKPTKPTSSSPFLLNNTVESSEIFI